MRSRIIVAVLALNTALAVWAATPASKKKGPAKSPPKSSSAKVSSSKTISKTSASKTAASNGKKSAAKGKKGTAPKQTAARYRRTTQREPAPERYQEIQQSLADKGYYDGPVNGNWGPDSVAALKHFQRDQNIGDDGKLGSLSLIALGLGPKRGDKQ